ncbi:MAG: glycosyltransferase family 2 protein [Methylococcaceae bacterium]|nr:glycosyltransferase family 2 protein [Methylococcaceae bacterium]
MKTCIIIPVYNHEAAIPQVLTNLKNFGIPTLLINDGSSAQCTNVLADCAKQETEWITLISRPENGGKGAAVLDGFKAALSLGFSHAIQIDADGQHDLNAIPSFLAASVQHPNVMILGQPLFDPSAPKSRLYGRRVTNFWISINTLSRAIADGMCGFRLYPLAAVGVLMRSTQIAERMDFDIDIVVRLYWQGVDAINIPVAVHYPLDGVSHFKLWRDNLMISKAHAKLFFGMLRRIPQLLKRQRQ